MNSAHFDRIARRLAEHRLSRRQALVGGTGLAVGQLVSTRIATFAQEATPSASPASLPDDPHPSADTAGTHPEFLFTQSFNGGTWVPKSGASGVYTLTLTGAAATTTYFSDRPERIVGLAPTQQFLDGLGFTPENPPNAALVTQTADGEQDILVIELDAPIYDAAAGTLTYEAKVLADYGERGLAYLARQQTDYELAASFGEGSLFIDDCPDSLLDGCYFADNNDWTGTWNFLGYISSGNCWNSTTWLCEPCGSYSYVCNETYPDDCNGPNGSNGGCKDDILLCGSPDCGPE